MAEIRAAVVTVSDSVSAGQNEDASGPRVAELLARRGFAVVERTTVPDGVDSVSTELKRLSGSVALIMTTGGTGLAERDVTPEATLEVIDREVPGLAEAMRSATFGRIPHGMLSRGVAGIRGSCLIVNLPGSPQAVDEGLQVIGPALLHAVEVASGEFGDHR
ncbi:MAG: MogA/MoaB family molybdenum cofactor biosynthesis protein [Acidimicrobiia bacterium]